MARPRAKIDAGAGSTVEKTIKRFDVPGRKIANVNVIPYRRTVWRVVIGAEDLHCRYAPLGRSDDEWDKVRLRCVVLANVAVGVSSRSIEIAQNRVA